MVVGPGEGECAEFTLRVVFDGESFPELVDKYNLDLLDTPAPHPNPDNLPGLVAESGLQDWWSGNRDGLGTSYDNILVEVSPGTLEWNEISKLLGSNMADADLTKLETVESAYNVEMTTPLFRRLRRAYGGLPGWRKTYTKYLWHGAESVDEMIEYIEDGFSVTPREDYGIGAYFHCSADSAAACAVPGTDTHQLLLSVVLVGESIAGTEGARRLPRGTPAGGRSGRYWSWHGSDDAGKRDVYVVDKPAKACPAYLVTFRYVDTKTVADPPTRV